MCMGAVPTFVKIQTTRKEHSWVSSEVPLTRGADAKVECFLDMTSCCPGRHGAKGNRGSLIYRFILLEPIALQRRIFTVGRNITKLSRRSRFACQVTILRTVARLKQRVDVTQKHLPCSTRSISSSGKTLCAVDRT